VLLNRIDEHRFTHWAGALLRLVLDAVFPPKCLVCNRLFKPAAKRPGIKSPSKFAGEIADPFPESRHLLTFFCCPNCVSDLTAISSPMCTCCGVAFKSQQVQNHLCGDCIVQPKKFTMARAAVSCDPQFMAIIHRFKYAGKTRLAMPLGGMMLSAFMRHWGDEEVDGLLPVPLHSQKFRSRGFNQSYLLIQRWKTIAKTMQIPLSNLSIHTDVLIRTKGTKPQTGLGRAQRLKNIRDAFSVQSPEKICGKKVLVVDDVYTTGATANECARMLLKFGAERVDVLTLARAI